MRELNLNKNNCLNSIPFSTFGIIIFISELISIIMNIILLVITSWNFLKKTIKTLNIIFLVIIVLTTFINIILFCSIGKIKKEIFQKHKSKIVAIYFLIMFYLSIIIFNIYNAIYLSLYLHIADYPEYGGRKRDQEYIDAHPNEFGNVSLKEFIIVAVCPSIICFFNLLSIIISILIRNKIKLIYNKEFQRLSIFNNIRNNHVINKNHKKHKKRRNSVNNIKSSEDIINNINNTDPIENKVKGNNKEIIKIDENNFEEGDEYEIKLTKKKETKEEIEEEKSDKIKEYNEKLPEKFFFGGREIKLSDENTIRADSLNMPKKIVINSIQGTKSTFNYKNTK